MDTKPGLSPHTLAWKRNLAFVWFSQFFSLVGFSFALTFAPLYIQQLGVSKQDSALWAGIFTAAASLSLALAAPFWGKLADRYGRRLMLLRANLGAAAILWGMGQVGSVQMLIGLRLIQGFFTGTVPAALTLVAVCTPENRQGLAVGSVTAAVFSGQMAGAAVGGYCADIFGYRACFEIAGGIMLIAALLAFGVEEKFLRPEREKPAGKITRRLFRMPDLGTALPILFLLFAMSIALRFDRPFIPLFVQELLHGRLAGASTITGQLAATGAIASMLAALLMGFLADRYPPLILGVLASLGSAFFVVSLGFAYGFTFLFLARAAMLFFAGGLHPLFSVWLVRTTPPKKRGAILGWATTARAMGWMTASLAGGVIARWVSIRAVFYAAGLLFLLLIPITSWVTRKHDDYENNNHPPRVRG